MTIRPREGHTVGVMDKASWVMVWPLSSPLHPTKSTLHLQINCSNDFVVMHPPPPPKKASRTCITPPPPLLITADIHPQTAATDTITHSNYCWIFNALFKQLSLALSLLGKPQTCLLESLREGWQGTGTRISKNKRTDCL